MTTESLAELVRFAPDVYGFRWVNHVAMFIVTDAGVVLVDANGQVNPRTPHLIKEAIRSVTAQPVKYFVYSHSAFDHSTGGAIFADTARFVGHRNAVEPIRAAKDPTTPVPDIVFDKPTSLELGGRKIDLHPADLSPTDDYVVVHDPAGRRDVRGPDPAAQPAVPDPARSPRADRRAALVARGQAGLRRHRVRSRDAADERHEAGRRRAARVLPRPHGRDRDGAGSRPGRGRTRDDDPGQEHPAPEVRRVATLRRVPGAEHPGHDRLARWESAGSALVPCLDRQRRRGDRSASPSSAPAPASTNSGRTWPSTSTAASCSAASRRPPGATRPSRSWASRSTTAKKSSSFGLPAVRSSWGEVSGEAGIWS